MGLAYSIFNEGIIAKTLFFGPPGGGMHAYDAFYFAGIHVVWTVIISTWHALHAMVFPIALVSALFPTVRQEPWLSMPVRVTLLVIWVPAAVLGFMKLNAQYADWRYFAAFAATIAVLLWLGARLPTRTPFFSNDGPGRAAQVGFGMALYVVLVVAVFIAADLGAPFVIVSIWPYGLVTVLYFWLRRKRWTTCLPVAFIALGNYGFGSFVNMLLHLDVDPKPADKIATLAILSVLFAAITFYALLRSKGKGCVQAVGDKGQRGRGTLLIAGLLRNQQCPICPLTTRQQDDAPLRYAGNAGQSPVSASRTLPYYAADRFISAGVLTA